MKAVNIYQAGYIFCNYYVETANGDADYYDYAITRYYKTNAYKYEKLVFKNKDFSNAEEFKNWLSTHNTTVYYVLEIPEEIDFDISGYNLADGVYYGESTQETTPSPENPSEIVNKETIDANILYPITGTTQYVRDNPFWELREDIAELLEDSKNAICGITINQFNCDWRGDISLEPGDKIALVTKDDNTVISYLLNDAIEYNGGLSQTSEWQYSDDEESESNPNNLGEALKQTSAKVDKANKKIDLLVSEVDANNSAISSLQMSTDAINANVQKDINELTNKVNATMTAEDVKIEIQNEGTFSLKKGENVLSVLIEQGLFEEVRGLLERGLTESDISMKGIGYKEIIGFFNGQYDREEAIDLIKKNTRHLAKRQLTWFRRYDDMKWLNISEFGSDEDAIEEMITWLKNR